MSLAWDYKVPHIDFNVKDRTGSAETAYLTALVTERLNIAPATYRYLCKLDGDLYSIIRSDIYVSTLILIFSNLYFPLEVITGSLFFDSFNELI